MKKFLLGLFGFCCSAAFAAGSTTPKGWLDDFNSAQKMSRELNRPLLLLVTGSDWCPYCVKLKKSALDKDDFKAYAKDNLILGYADFPRRAQLPPELVAQNRELAEKFGVSGFPTTIIFAPDGRELGRIIGATPDYLERVKKIAGGK